MLKKTTTFFFFSKRGATERYNKGSNSVKSIILNRLFWQHSCGHNYSTGYKVHYGKNFCLVS